MVLRAAERLDALPVLRAGLVDVARDRRRADEADRRDVGVLEHPLDRDLVPLDDVEDAVGHAGLLQELGDEHRGGRVLLGRLQDERVAAGDRGRPHPHGHHRGEVERRDARRRRRAAGGSSTRRSRSRPARRSGPGAASGCRRRARSPRARARPRRARRRAPCRARASGSGRCPCGACGRARGSRTGAPRASRATARARPGTPPARRRPRGRPPRRSRNRRRRSARRSRGCRRGRCRPDSPGTILPPIQWLIRFGSRSSPCAGAGASMTSLMFASLVARSEAYRGQRRAARTRRTRTRASSRTRTAPGNRRARAELAGKL